MSCSLRGRSRSLRSIVLFGAVSGLTVAVPAGCSSGGQAEVLRPTVGAITACLTAAQEQYHLPIDEASGVDVSVEVDHQGWWAVHAVTHSGGTTQTLVCTAVPDSGPTGARAASFSVSEG